MQSLRSVGSELHPLGQLEQPIDEASLTARGDPDGRNFQQTPRGETETLGVVGAGPAWGKFRARLEPALRHCDQKSCASDLLRRGDDVAEEAFVHQRISQPSRGRA